MLFPVSLAGASVVNWIVNTIRYKLKQTGEACYLTEIVRRLSTQKAVTTEATNNLGEKLHMRLCSEPNRSADDIYERLKVGSINSLCQIFDLSLSAECQFLRERCGHRDR